MGYLEKVFLGTLLLFALLIIFMFGLYFDVGSMLQASARKMDSAGAHGGFERSTAQVERQAVKAEITVKDTLSTPFARRPVALSGVSAGDANFVAIFAQCNQAAPNPTVEQLGDKKRKELASKGFSSEYIEMEVRGDDDKAVYDSCEQIDALIAKRSFDEAERLLLEQIGALDPRDLMNLQRLRMKLQQVYFESEQLDKYREVMKSVFETEEKILSIQAASPLIEDKRIADGLKKEQEALQSKKAEFDPWFDHIQKQAQETGSVHKLPETMKAEIKAGLLREKEAGRITPQDLQDALSQLEQMESRAANSAKQ